VGQTVGGTIAFSGSDSGSARQFLQQYERKKRPGKGEPNDRKYDRSIEDAVKRMDPEELDALVRGDDSDDPETAVTGKMARVWAMTSA
jgi:hypothetical protein